MASAGSEAGVIADDDVGMSEHRPGLDVLVTLEHPPFFVATIFRRIYNDNHYVRGKCQS